MSRSEVAIPIPTKLFIELAEFLRSHGSDRDPVDAVGVAIEFWMRNFDSDGSAGAQLPALDDIPTTVPDGYWWKKLFIPTGSKIRMSYKGKVYFADVVSNGFWFEGKIRSPSELTFTITKTSRNAWRDIEIKFPGAEKWVLADQLRHQAEVDALI